MLKRYGLNIISLCELTDDTECVSIYLASNIRKIMNDSGTNGSDRARTLSHTTGGFV